jgi:DNA-binding winged helix-turn-helix (wHTH) protein
MWRRKADDWCTSRVSRRSILLAVNCEPRGAPVPIGCRAFDIIEVLVCSAGELVTKHDLTSRVWPGVIVEDNALQFHISAIRKALGPDRELLRTACGRGYRLLGDWTFRQESTSPAGSIDLEPVKITAEPFQTNLPAAASDLVGRTTAVRHLRDLLSAYRLVTLTGPGGRRRPHVRIVSGAPKFLSHASIIANRPGCHSALDANVHRLEGDAARFAFCVTPGLIRDSRWSARRPAYPPGEIPAGIDRPASSCSINSALTPICTSSFTPGLSVAKRPSAEGSEPPATSSTTPRRTVPDSRGAARR